ncbi:MAG TPA: hydantoinase/oxoprolinase N-terminal domain-containing protein, partial [Gaiellaceae bacterium]|nr:hydantoinase/oxoprolinase N-terminal domain-containing protein [Gaiellaceae bacterium]
MAILGVDVGGTFTDAVLVEERRIRTAKVPTAMHQEESVLAAARAVGAAEGVERFAHGTTVATNALLERRGARTALVTTEGFEDVVAIGRQTRPRLYALAPIVPPALVP